MRKVKNSKYEVINFSSQDLFLSLNYTKKIYCQNDNQIYQLIKNDKFNNIYNICTK